MMEQIFRFSRSRYFWLLFACLTIFVYFFGLTIPLLGPDEPRYAQVAREMFERSDWVTPTLAGYNWFEKPSLLYWLQIASYHILGVNEFAARFGSALFGLGTILSLWMMGRYAVANGENANGNEFPKWLAMVAASTIGIIVFSRGASFDIILTFPIAASLVSYFIFEHSRTEDSRSRLLGLIGYYFFIGVSVLAKGLVGAVFPLAVVSFYHLISWKRPSRSFLMSLVPGGLLSLGVAATWYLPMYLRHGWEFIDEFIIQHHFQRYTSNKYRHPQPFHFFFWVLPLMTIPWIPFFFVGVWSAAKRMFSPFASNSDAEGVGPSSLIRFAFAWMLVPLVFFSFSGSKLPGYIMPAVPAAVVLAAISVYRFAMKSDGRRAFAQFISVGTFATVITLLIFVVPGYSELDSVKSLMRSANDRGYSDLKVVSMNRVFHNAEFYAAGRLIRNEDGTQMRVDKADEVVAVMERNETDKILVLIPSEHQERLIGTEIVKTEVIRDSGEAVIVLASRE
jgi:4-amino-4-deoxy-L-arabinose transferase-like glycosyltransferase